MPGSWRRPPKGAPAAIPLGPDCSGARHLPGASVEPTSDACLFGVAPMEVAAFHPHSCPCGPSRGPIRRLGGLRSAYTRGPLARIPPLSPTPLPAPCGAAAARPTPVAILPRRDANARPRTRAARCPKTSRQLNTGNGGRSQVSAGVAVHRAARVSRSSDGSPRSLCR